MTELVITRGYPASGKTTWALAQARTDGWTKAPSRDDLRIGMFGKEKCTDAEEKVVSRVQLAAVRRLLDDGENVIVDDTNLQYRIAQGWANLAERYGISFRCVDFPVAPEECKRRNEERRQAGGRYVPPDVIDRMAKRYPMKDWKPVEPKFRLDIEPVTYRPELPSAYIFDIDGTVAHMTGRSPYDYSRVGEDAQDFEVRQVFKSLAYSDNTPSMIFVSGRSDDCREVTSDWLSAHAFSVDALYMRKSGDDRDDAVVKLEIFNKHIRGNYNVLGVFDDRDRVVSMWRQLGLKCFQVQPGDF
ncbi:AAA family ATPase [Nocardia vinacea]|uniref:phosphatase domain-containing protein n=1 Tax=Nocardia vinacea TaxID=96468 RepID=UPI0033CA74E6